MSRTIAFDVMPYDLPDDMLGEDTYNPSGDRYEFYDWRFGSDGNPHAATCGTCGRRTDEYFIDPTFRMKRRNWDLGETRDGDVIVSQRFRDYCRKRRLAGVTFDPLPADDAFLVLRLHQVLPFDAERRGTRFEKPCPECGGFCEVIGASPAFLLGVEEPIRSGLFRSDLRFGSGPLQSPLIIAGLDTGRDFEELGFKKFDMQPIEA